MTTNLNETFAAVQVASRELALLNDDVINQILNAVADAAIAETRFILSENEKDLARMDKNDPKYDRLKLTEERLKGIAADTRNVATLPSPLGKILKETVRPNGMKLTKISVPFGVIGIIYEARPNVTADAFGLCFKTGNAVILKGGSDAIHSNIAIVKILQDALEACGMPRTAVQLIEDTDRAVTAQFMKMKEYVDVLIPRGGAGLIRSVVENSTIPVIETGTGNCHVYVDQDADVDMAVKILMNAKTQRIGVCNACESLVVHRAIRDRFLPKMAETLKTKNVELRGDESTLEILPDCIPATEEDYGTEYLDYILSIKTVDSVDEAIAHINRYNTKHSECIVTENAQTAEKFLNEVDAACVYVNASTRFTDGFEFGFGAEIGISTQKLHARGPMGLKELTSYKYKIDGNGQIRG